MRLIDVEALGHPAQGDRPPAGSAEAATPETTTAFALHAIAKLLNSLLHILFVASAEVLCPSRCAADAHRLRRPLGPRAIEGQARKIAVARAPARPPPPPPTRNFPRQGKEGAGPPPNFEIPGPPPHFPPCFFLPIIAAARP